MNGSNLGFVAVVYVLHKSVSQIISLFIYTMRFMYPPTPRRLGFLMGIKIMKCNKNEVVILLSLLIQKWDARI